MTNITLGGNVLDYIVDTLFNEENMVSNPEWVNQISVDIDTNVWAKKPIFVTYRFRLTDDEKWILDQLLLACSLTTLVDSTYTLNNSVWILSVDAIWEGNINYTKPWLFTIELVIVV